MIQNRTITTSLLGSYLDGWADLVENIGTKEALVKDEIMGQLIGRNLPKVQVETISAKPGIFISNLRDYLMVSTPPGVTTLIYIDTKGRDLYTSWRSYIKPPVNWKLLEITIKVILTLAFISAFFITLVQIYQSIWNFFTYISDNWSIFINLSWESLIYLIGIFVFIVIILAVAGQVDHKSTRWYFTFGYLIGAIIVSCVLVNFVMETYFKEYTPFIQTARDLSKLISQSTLQFLLSGILFTVSGFIAFIVGAMIVGFFVKKDIFYYLTIQPNLFDAEDITAMNLAVHKSILRALDLQGIPSDKLRLKQNFKGGRKNEVV